MGFTGGSVGKKLLLVYFTHRVTPTMLFLPLMILQPRSQGCRLLTVSTTPPPFAHRDPLVPTPRPGRPTGGPGVERRGGGDH